MIRLAKIAKSARPGPGMRIRKSAYGSAHVPVFLRDVLGLANASVDGPRYIIVDGEDSIPEADFTGTPDYAALVGEFIEPALRVRYEAVTIDNKRIGVFEIGECHDRPYMMRIDHSDHLRRGDAYISIDRSPPVRMGRSQLQSLFEGRFRDSISPKTVEIGFPADFIRKEMQLETIDLATLPSAVASRKLKEMIAVIARSKGTGSTSTMSRLTHAKLFGSDSPYRNKTTSELMQQMEQAPAVHREADAHYLFEECAGRIQLVIVNQSSDPLKGPSLSLVLPRHNALFVAATLPRVPQGDGFTDRSPLELDSYPPVIVREDYVRVSVTLDDIPGGMSVPAFQSPLRICAGSRLKGRRIAIHYTLSAGNLGEPAAGKLRLLF